MWTEMSRHFWPLLKHGQMITVKEDGKEKQAVFCSSTDEWWVVDQHTNKELAPTHYFKT